MRTEELTDAEATLCRRHDFKDRTTTWIVLGAAGLMVLSALILAWHAYRWLMDGFWPDNTWADGFDFMGLAYPRTEAVGAQRIIDWVMGLGLWSLPFLVAILGSWLWLMWADYETPETKDALRKRTSLRAQRHFRERDAALAAEKSRKKLGES